MNPVRALLDKEFRQLGRSRGALVSGTLLPLLLLVLVPLPQLAGLEAAPIVMPEGLPLPPGFSDIGDARGLFALLLYPLFVTIAGLIVPSLAATYSVVQERERRTLELLVALPVSVRQILTAKLLSLLALGVVLVFPFFAIGITIPVLLGVISPSQAALLLLLLSAALVCSTCVALVLALLAKDFRTANNLNGVLFLPILMLMSGLLLSVPGEGKLLVMSAALIGCAALAIVIATSWISFERYVE